MHAAEAVSRIIGLVVIFVAGPLVAAPEFLPAGDCGFCHSRPGIVTRANGHHESWKSSMMASAVRDPYWQAQVERESAASGKAVEDKCLRCHAAADQYDRRALSKPMRMSELTALGREGVTCTVCHRITAEGLGSSASYTGGFRLASDPVLFGPHEQPFTMPMMHHTGYQPTASRHMLDSALCGSCHTLLLSDSKGQPVFAEQATYPEWRASAWPSRNTSCQTCHVPQVRRDNGELAADYIAHRPPGGAFPPTRPRTPVGRHTFVGANAQMLDLLAESNLQSGYAERAAATRKFLETALSLDATTERQAGQLVVNVRVQNRTGHKLPTGVPVRQLWLHVVVHDEAGRVVFESGKELGNTAFRPHLREITRPEQAMVYEAVMEDARGELTPLFTRAARYCKDNRLLPQGFSTERVDFPAAWVAPVGVEGDADFVAGSDIVRYRIDATRTSGPLRTTVEALYRGLGQFESGVPARRPVVIGRTAVSETRGGSR